MDRLRPQPDKFSPEASRRLACLLEFCWLYVDHCPCGKEKTFCSLPWKEPEAPANRHRPGIAWNRTCSASADVPTCWKNCSVSTRKSAFDRAGRSSRYFHVAPSCFFIIFHGLSGNDQNCGQLRMPDSTKASAGLRPEPLLKTPSRNAGPGVWGGACHRVT